MRQHRWERTQTWQLVKLLGNSLEFERRIRELLENCRRLTGVTHAVAERVSWAHRVCEGRGVRAAPQGRVPCRTLAPPPIDTGQRPRQRSATGALPARRPSAAWSNPHSAAAAAECRAAVVPVPANYYTQITLKYALFVCGSREARMLWFCRRAECPFLRAWIILWIPRINF